MTILEMGPANIQPLVIEDASLSQAFAVVQILRLILLTAAERFQHAGRDRVRFFRARSLLIGICADFVYKTPLGERRRLQSRNL